MADIASLLQNLEPISRNIALTSFVLSFSSLALGILDAYRLVYLPQAIFNFTKPEIWRLATSLVLSSPGFGIILDPYFIYMYGSSCERTRFRRFSGDYPFFLVFVSVIIIALNHYVTGFVTFTSPLILALCYYHVAFEPSSARGQIFMFQIPIKFMPLAMLVMAGLQGGMPAVIHGATGAVAAHAYLFLTEIWPKSGSGNGESLIKTPRWFVRLFAERQDRGPPEIRVRRNTVVQEGVRVGGDAGATGSSATQGRPGGAFRGTGHRLG
ncbi:hypothetical protein EX30DRAFT_328704 [Ascodesmis nigricans]|uniref:Derlin n=1 Tax=Ascodesmis nigricans TaxID=341454 RepID=A0A4S2N151_9PEZI|nr:hypothetical protein EX30DRAFT_328704 [Ascodesmis nigricans]